MDAAAEHKIAEATEHGVDLMNEKVEPADEDFCRICRAESTVDQPLFHPCKCSGSVAFVHQECLKEWLRHSQKQYCELCKTHFRFTKLYDPNMPSSIPVIVFLSKFSRQIVSSILIWLRALLVGVAWLGALPLTVKILWQFFFNLADTVLLSTPATSASKNTTSSALASLTRSPKANMLLVFTFQGQILAAIVSACFIAAFLVREWVIQNAMNMFMDQNVEPPRQIEAPQQVLNANMRNEENQAGQDDLEFVQGTPPVELTDHLNGTVPLEPERVQHLDALGPSEEEAFDRRKNEMKRNFRNRLKQAREERSTEGTELSQPDEGSSAEAPAPEAIFSVIPQTQVLDAENQVLDTLNAGSTIESSNTSSSELFFDALINTDALDLPEPGLGTAELPAEINLPNHADEQPMNQPRRRNIWNWFRAQEVAAEEPHNEGAAPNEIHNHGIAEDHNEMEPMHDDDMEDAEGIMELIGMRGPIFALFSNVFFTCILFGAAMCAGIFIPYFSGKALIIIMQDPFFYLVFVPVKSFKFTSEFVVDFATFITGTLFRYAYHVLSAMFRTVSLPHSRPIEGFHEAVSRFTLHSWERLIQQAISLQSLVRAHAMFWPPRSSPSFFLDMTAQNWSLPITIHSRDRLLSVATGYIFLTICGAILLHHTARWSREPWQNGARRALGDTLRQSGAVVKIIFVIGIELAVFPTFCGVLLDLSTLPLFEGATVTSRVNFYAAFPFTSGFLHWFVGTCYMFHFAMFVSMCREIMRPGTLCKDRQTIRLMADFIRDPNDPEFHPMKDILDKSVFSQLRKIAYSAFIYSFLVLVCLGGVVHFLATETRIFPIKWTSSEPVLELPVDLLLYHVCMPLALQLFKPSDVYRALWGRYLRCCASFLRLSSFLFNERNPKEEGTHQRLTWDALFHLRQGDDLQPREAIDISNDEKEDAVFVKDGQFLRVPARDSIKVKPGKSLFIPVSELDERLDDDENDPEYSPDDFTVVYSPPHRRMRLFMYMACIWAFAALGGVVITIIPLVFGRLFFAVLLPDDARLHDIYALSSGAYVLGGIALLARQTVLKWERLTAFFSSVRKILSSLEATRGAVWSLFRKLSAIGYVYGFGILVIPGLFALLMEAYIIIPLHTYFATDQQPIVHFIQDWTLGVLYMKLMARLLMWDNESPWGRAMQEMMRDGYMSPNVLIATRAFILPIAGSMILAMVFPLTIAFTAGKTFRTSSYSRANQVHEASPDELTKIYRYSYPLVIVLMLIVLVAYGIWRLSKQWVQHVRDEVYLVGEQLHNFGDNEAPPTLLYE